MSWLEPGDDWQARDSRDSIDSQSFGEDEGSKRGKQLPDKDPVVTCVMGVAAVGILCSVVWWLVKWLMK